MNKEEIFECISNWNVEDQYQIIFKILKYIQDRPLVCCCNCCCKPLIKEYKLDNGNTFKIYETCRYRFNYYGDYLNCKRHGKYKGILSLYISKKSPYMNDYKTQCPKCK